LAGRQLHRSRSQRRKAGRSIVAPKGTPAEIIDKLNQAVNAVLANPELKARLVDLGGVPMPMTPAKFGKLVADETAKWSKVIYDAKIEKIE
jgi:tripartite-type tricarboxylate transporter receptor subunit TctC